ncbi:MAG TPA: 2-phosphosulfolactate phosphatase [Blastocatellia bacterium]|nr:2-phosphosulfolactate phosphatase [Blastocatellia bacterium]
MMSFDQSSYSVRCEWGEKGVSLLAPVSDVVIIVDVLSFSTAVEIATSRGGIIYPYGWRDDSACSFAESVDAEVAGKTNPNGYSLSPSSLLEIASGKRLVLPSPNGSQLSLMSGTVVTIAGCLRNCQAVAESALRKGTNIAVVPAGERWPDKSLRPCFEDLVGAGAVIRWLRGTLSPEAIVALAAFQRAASDLSDLIKRCSSGREKIAKGDEADLALASALNKSDCVPLLTNRAYRRE